MASTSASRPLPPLANKRAQGPVGSDLIVTYHSDLAQCALLPAGLRYTNAGNFKAGTLLPFTQPDFIHHLYPRLLSANHDEGSGLPLLLSMFNMEAKTATLEDDWEGKWFTITARIIPNKLTFTGVKVDGWEGDDAEDVQVALALPRDGALTPILPRFLSSSDSAGFWPTTSAHASFAGPVDLDTFRIKDDALPKALYNTAVFVKLGTYLLPEGDRLPHKGVHSYHVLLIFPIEQQPWRSLLGWMREATNPFAKGSWITASGRVLGVLNRDLIQGPEVIDSSVRILVILPDDWEFIRQGTLSTHQPSTPSSSTSAKDLPTTPQRAGSGSFLSRNPFSSPSRGRQHPQPQVAPTTLPVAPVPHEAGPPSTEPTSSSATDINDPESEDGLDVEHQLDDQLASASTVLSHKRGGSVWEEPSRKRARGRQTKAAQDE